VPKKICNFSDCHNIIPGNEKYCEEHKKSLNEIKTLNNRRYDTKVRHERDKQYTKFYHSKEWEALRIYVLRTYKDLDLFAYFIENTITSASTGHHIVEIKDDWNLRLTIDNILPVSDASHKKIHTLYRQDKEGTQKLLRGLLQQWEKLKICRKMSNFQGEGDKKSLEQG
jgi:hypothetical protein